MMKSIVDLIHEQESEVKHFKDIAVEFVESEIRSIPYVTGALLAGSTARGDARKGPFGFRIDIVVVLEEGGSIDLNELFGESVEPPEIPFHCINQKNEYIGLEVATIDKLRKIREQPESVIFAKNESLILYDKIGDLKRWKKEAFVLTDDDIKNRALKHYFRFRYLTGDYRNEKWSYRKTWIQIAQNYNEACECYCDFLHCINGKFIPRKDWLVYLTFGYKYKPENHSELIENMYRTYLSDDEIKIRHPSLKSAGSSMQ